MKSWRRYRGGFTLVEVLLVVVIMMVVTAIAVPSFTRSLRGAKLRASTRTAIAISRYSRTVAVLQQVQAALLIDTALNTFELVSISNPDSDANKFINDTAGTDGETGAATVESLMVRHLEPGVKVVAVRGDGRKELPQTEGIYTVMFYPNGMCDAYELELLDDLGKRMRLSVDPLSGKSTMEEVP